MAFATFHIPFTSTKFRRFSFSLFLIRRLSFSLIRLVKTCRFMFIDSNAKRRIVKTLNKIYNFRNISFCIVYCKWISCASSFTLFLSQPFTRIHTLHTKTSTILSINHNCIFQGTTSEMIERLCIHKQLHTFKSRILLFFKHE